MNKSIQLVLLILFNVSVSNAQPSKVGEINTLLKGETWELVGSKSFEDEDFFAARLQKYINKENNELVYIKKTYEDDKNHRVWFYYLKGQLLKTVDSFGPQSSTIFYYNGKQVLNPNSSSELSLDNTKYAGALRKLGEEYLDSEFKEVVRRSRVQSKKGLSDDLWITDIQKAIELSKKESKPIFLDFTGSDWCGYCIRLKNNVFHSKEFVEYAKENLILVELDFPRRFQLDPNLAKQNKFLKEAFQVRGFPTLLLVDERMEKSLQYFRTVGYRSESAKEYIAQLNPSVNRYQKKRKK